MFYLYFVLWGLQRWVCPLTFLHPLGVLVWTSIYFVVCNLLCLGEISGFCFYLLHCVLSCFCLMLKGMVLHLSNVYIDYHQPVIHLCWSSNPFLFCFYSCFCFLQPFSCFLNFFVFIVLLFYIILCFS